MSHYVVAVRRSQADFQLDSSNLEKVPGVKVTAGNDPKMMIVEATPQAAEQLANQLRDVAMVEREVHYERA